MPIASTSQTYKTLNKMSITFLYLFPQTLTILVHSTPPVRLHSHVSWPSLFCSAFCPSSSTYLILFADSSQPFVPSIPGRRRKRKGLKLAGEMNNVPTISGGVDGSACSCAEMSCRRGEDWGGGGRYSLCQSF